MAAAVVTPPKAKSKLESLLEESNDVKHGRKAPLDKPADMLHDKTNRGLEALESIKSAGLGALKSIGRAGLTAFGAALDFLSNPRREVTRLRTAIKNSAEEKKENKRFEAAKKKVEAVEKSALGVSDDIVKSEDFQKLSPEKQKYVLGRVKADLAALSKLVANRMDKLGFTTAGVEAVHKFLVQTQIPAFNERTANLLKQVLTVQEGRAEAEAIKAAIPERIKAAEAALAKEKSDIEAAQAKAAQDLLNIQRVLADLAAKYAETQDGIAARLEKVAAAAPDLVTRVVAAAEEEAKLKRKAAEESVTPGPKAGATPKEQTINIKLVSGAVTEVDGKPFTPSEPVT